MNTGFLRGGTPEARELMERISTEHEMPCVATFLSDPFFSAAGAAQVTDIAADGTLIHDTSDTTESVPVLLFEPVHLMAMSDAATGTMSDLRIEGMISGGFHRVPSRFLIPGLPADGWGVYRTDDGVVLRNADGGVHAASTLTLDPEWVSAATSYGSVLVLFGPQLGVRVPPGRSAASYTLTERIQEFRQCRRDGLVIAATVKWHGERLSEALKWVLLPEGAFGQPLPLAYLPAWNLTPDGGPEAFGFTPLTGIGHQELEIHNALGLAAHLGPTDFDLIRSGVDPDLSFITGYHAQPGDERFDAWRQSALRHGRVLVVAGEQELPTGENVDAQHARQVLTGSAAAGVLLTEESFTAASTEDWPGATVQDHDPDADADYTRALTEKIRGQESFSVHIADTIASLIPPDELRPWLSRLWPITCQTCGEPLGVHADLSADGPTTGDRVLITLHHSACRRSGNSLTGHGYQMTRPTASFAAGYLGDPGKPRRRDIPVMVVNPSCEHLLLARDAGPKWRDATLDEFAALGFAPPARKRPASVSGVQAELSGSHLTITATSMDPSHRHVWTLEPAEHVLQQVRRLKGVVVTLTTKTLPALLRVEDLPDVVLDPAVLTGWVHLQHPAST